MQLLEVELTSRAGAPVCSVRNFAEAAGTNGNLISHSALQVHQCAASRPLVRLPGQSGRWEAGLQRSLPAPFCSHPPRTSPSGAGCPARRLSLNRLPSLNRRRPRRPHRSRALTVRKCRRLIPQTAAQSSGRSMCRAGRVRRAPSRALSRAQRSGAHAAGQPQQAEQHADATGVHAQQQQSHSVSIQMSSDNPADLVAAITSALSNHERDSTDHLVSGSASTGSMSSLVVSRNPSLTSFEDTCFITPGILGAWSRWCKQPNRNYDIFPGIIPEFVESGRTTASCSNGRALCRLQQASACRPAIAYHALHLQD